MHAAHAEQGQGPGPAPLEVLSRVPVRSVNTSPQMISRSSLWSASFACAHSAGGQGSHNEELARRCCSGACCALLNQDPMQQGT